MLYFSGANPFTTVCHGGKEENGISSSISHMRLCGSKQDLSVLLPKLMGSLEGWTHLVVRETYICFSILSPSTFVYVTLLYSIIGMLTLIYITVSTLKCGVGV